MNVGVAANASQDFILTGGGTVDEVYVYDRAIDASEELILNRYVEQGVIHGSMIVADTIPSDRITGLGGMAYADAVELAQLGSTVIQGGFLKTDLLDVGYILGEDATFRGTLEASKGLFSGSIESGPLQLSISPPSSSSITTDGKGVRTIIEELLASGVNPGSYVCSGTIGGDSINRIDFGRSLPSGSIETDSYHYRFYDYFVYGFQYYRYIRYREHVATSVYNLSLFDGDTSIVSVSQELVSSNGYWVIDSGIINGYPPEPRSEMDNAFGGPPGPGTTIYTKGDYTAGTVPGNGSVSFTSGAFTMKMIQLPAYNASLPQWTVYLETDGGDDYFLKVKGN